MYYYVSIFKNKNCFIYGGSSKEYVYI